MTIAFIATIPASGIWSTYPNDGPLKFDYWPEPIVKAINGSRRVYGEGSGRIDGSFYFLGGTGDVNVFLAQIAQGQGIPISVELTSRPGNYQVNPALLPDTLNVDCAWTLILCPNVVHDPARRDGEPPEEYETRKRAERAARSDLAALVTIHCVGPIDPARLKIPLQCKVRVRDRLSDLADLHNSRRDEAERDRTPFDKLPPTTEPDREAKPNPLFGDPATRPAAGHGG